MNCNLLIDGKSYSFPVSGIFERGVGGVLFRNSILASREDVLDNSGYRVERILTDSEFSNLSNSIQDKIFAVIKRFGVSFKDKTFKIEDYHKYVTTAELHNKIIGVTRNFQNHDFDFDLEEFCERLGRLLCLNLSAYNPELRKTHIQIRISRPDSLDINPPHRDSYLSYWENVVNLWIPIAGCTNLSVLPVIPGSHQFQEEDLIKTESKGAEINGNKYIVPCILSHKNTLLEMIRPKLNYGDALIFTPYLIHGSAVNLGIRTRVALELRLTIL